MKTGKKAILLIGSLLIIGFAILMISQRLFHEKTAFDVPQKAAYVFVYSTGENSDEKTEIDYLDEKGNLISRNTLDNATSTDAFSRCDCFNNYNLFTHDTIYFSGDKKTSIDNTEMQTTYKFASDNGVDTVYNSGFVKKINMYYKFIPHGLSYAQKDSGAFDLVTLYDDRFVHNIKVIEGATISVQQSTGDIYLLAPEGSETIDYNIIKYNHKEGQFHKTTEKLDLGIFYDKYVGRENVVTLKKSVIHNNTLYQIISVGEEKSKTYLAEIAIPEKTGQLRFLDAYPVDLKADESITYDVPVIISDSRIKFFSVVKPNKVISFDIETKKFDYYSFLEDTATDEDNWYKLRIIDDVLYAMQISATDNRYSIFKIRDTGKKTLLIEGDLPKTEIRDNHWIADFYVIEADQQDEQ